MKKFSFNTHLALSMLIATSFTSTQVHAAEEQKPFLDINKKSIFVNKVVTKDDKGVDKKVDVYASILEGCNKILLDKRDVSATMMSLVIAMEYINQQNNTEPLKTAIKKWKADTSPDKGPSPEIVLNPKFYLCELIVTARNAAYEEKKSKRPYSKKKKLECSCANETKELDLAPDADLTNDAVHPAKAAHRAINFCQYSYTLNGKKLLRPDMPQLSGLPTDNNCLAMQLLRNNDPRVKPTYKKEVDLKEIDLKDLKEIDLTEVFVDYLKEKGFKVTTRNVDAFQLKATQNELDAWKVASMWLALKIDPNNKDLKASIFTAQREDDASYYILDGHHRWAAIMATEFGLSHLTRVFLPAKVVNTDIENLFNIAWEFATAYGLPPKTVK